VSENDEKSEYGLLVSFEDQSASYVHGYEAGGIWQRMRSGTEAEIEIMVHSVNRETLRRMAVADGWSVEFTPTEFDEWVSMKMEKQAKPIDHPNPHGLRVVN